MADDLAFVADLVRDQYQTYVAFHSDFAAEHAGTVTLWTLHTYAYKAAGVTPYILLHSATAGAGKSTFFQVAERLVANPSYEISPTPAVVRGLAAGHTLLLDEIDELYADANFKAVLNAGYKDGPGVSRFVRGQIEKTPVFGPKAFAGIGREGLPLSNATLDRCIQIEMRPYLPNEKPTRFVGSKMENKSIEVCRLSRTWARNPDTQFALQNADPVMPAAVTGRPAEIWRPLIAIADLIGEPWSTDARRWAVRINAARTSAPDENIMIVSDLHSVLADHTPKMIKVADLADSRNSLAEREYPGDLNAYRLGRRVARFGIKSEPVKGERVYRVRDDAGEFTPEWNDVFSRYLGG